MQIISFLLVGKLNKIYFLEIKATVTHLSKNLCFKEQKYPVSDFIKENSLKLI